MMSFSGVFTTSPQLLSPPACLSPLLTDVDWVEHFLYSKRNRLCSQFSLNIALTSIPNQQKNPHFRT